MPSRLWHRTQSIRAALLCGLALLVVGARPGAASLVPAARTRLREGHHGGALLRPCSCGEFFGVAAISRSDVWAVGRAEAPLIEHWDGVRWRIVHSPSVAREGGELRAIAAVSAHDIWAVGDAGGAATSIRTLTEHWDGTRWRVVPSPNPAGSSWHALTAVAVVAHDDVWAVGHDYNANGLIEHWDGRHWRSIPNPQGGSGVAAVAAHDVWTVAGGPTIAHWDGTRWRVVPSPDAMPSFAPGADVGLDAITAVSAHDIWAVGNFDASNCCRAGSGPLVEHWDGARWRIVPSPNLPDAVSTNSGGITFSGVAAVSSRDVWAVGTGGVEHWNGTRWRIIHSPILEGGSFGPVSVAALLTRDVWAVGTQSNTESLVEHWDGARRRIVPTPNTVP